MSRIYTVSFAGAVTSAGGDTDWCELTPGDDNPIRLRGIVLGNYSEVGDSAEEVLRFSIIRVLATVTSGNGTSATPRPMNDNDVAATFTAETNATTIATTSTSVETLMEFAWNIRNTPYEIWFPDPDFAPVVRQADVLVVRQQTALADDMSAAFTAFVEEI